MISLNEHILNQDNPYEYVYECLSGTHGNLTMDYLTEMYNQVSIDCGYHPRMMILKVSLIE